MRHQATLEPGVLLGLDLRDLELLLDVLRVATPDRVANRPRGQAGVDPALDQVILGPRVDGRLGCSLVVKPGEHDHGDAGRHRPNAVDRLHPESVRQPEVEEDAVDVTRALAERLAHRAPVDDANVEGSTRQQFLHEHRVAVIVLDQ
ncbi:MAG TPA: hypothetical protein VG294_11455 [Solirubrobacteraceae bacterium]|nr:hypothetical protein [Solirubrobacteraceae bacterium]